MKPPYSFTTVCISLTDPNYPIKLVLSFLNVTTRVLNLAIFPLVLPCIGIHVLLYFALLRFTGIAFFYKLKARPSKKIMTHFIGTVWNQNFNVSKVCLSWERGSQPELELEQKWGYWMWTAGLSSGHGSAPSRLPKELPHLQKIVDSKSYLE